MSTLQCPPADRARRADPEPGRRSAAGQAAGNRAENTCSKFERERFRHVCRLRPADSLNHSLPDSGTPRDSIRPDDALASYFTDLMYNCTFDPKSQIINALLLVSDCQNDF